MSNEQRVNYVSLHSYDSHVKLVFFFMIVMSLWVDIIAKDLVPVAS